MEDEQTGQSRLFVILAIALIGLLVLGLLGIGGVFVIRQNLQEQAALTQATPTIIIKLPNPTATPIPTKASAANAPAAPTPTNTPVVSAGSSQGQEAAVGNEGGNGAANGPISLLPAPTRTPVAGAEEAGLPDQVPETGLGALEMVLIAAGLIFVLFFARRLRTSS